MADNYENSMLLFIGEGNFSFSSGLTTCPGFRELKCQLVATDFVPELESAVKLQEGSCGDESDKKESRKSFTTEVLKRNVDKLKSCGHDVLLDVDATKLHAHLRVKSLLTENTCQKQTIFVIFNFPHVKSKKMKIGLNRDLLRDFFQSCDKLIHDLNSCPHDTSDHCNCSLDTIKVVPVVSLCAGQSGIDEVESIQRSWGDSWQINDMAAQGNFVCCNVQKFTEWKLASMLNSEYEPSYYRLQTGVRFTTDKALTLTYLHRPHVNPNQVDRLSQSVYRFKDADADSSHWVISEFSSAFQPILKEDVEFSDQQGLPYHHLVFCQKALGKVEKYLMGNVAYTVEVIQKTNIQVYSDSTKTSTIVGRMGDDVMIIYADVLLTLRHQNDYRFLMSLWKVPKSLFPHCHEFHISFWVLKNVPQSQENTDKLLFSKDLFVQILLQVYGLMLKTVEFVEEFVDSKGCRTSFCFRVRIESLDLPLGRTTAHQLYLQLRQQLSNGLLVELR